MEFLYGLNLVAAMVSVLVVWDASKEGRPGMTLVWFGIATVNAGFFVGGVS